MKTMRRVIVGLVLVVAVLAGVWAGYSELGPKSDRERMEQVCGPDPRNASIMDDGSVCCDLCAGTSSA
jgi:hypothetical protein